MSSALTEYYLPISSSTPPLITLDGMPSPSELVEAYANERGVQIDPQDLRFLLAFQVQSDTPLIPTQSGWDRSDINIVFFFAVKFRG